MTINTFSAILWTIGITLSITGGTCVKYRQPGIEFMHAALERLALLGRLLLFSAIMLLVPISSTGIIVLIVITSVLHLYSIHSRFELVMKKGNKITQLSRYTLPEDELWSIDESPKSKSADLLTFIAGALTTFIVLKSII